MSCPIIEIYCYKCNSKIKHMINVKPIRDVSLLSAANHFGIHVFTSIPLFQGKLLTLKIDDKHLANLPYESTKLLQFVRSTPGIVSPLVGQKTLDHTNQNIAISNYPRLTDDEFKEVLRSFESLKKYRQSYYPQWKPEYDQYVTAQFEALQTPDFTTATWASALTYQMIYEQPVVYEFKNIKAPTLIIIGEADRTVVGKNLLSAAIASQRGNYPLLGRWLQNQIKGSKLKELKGVGHIPHIQSLPQFREAVLNFLR